MTYDERHHLHCEAPWICGGCGERVCPRCEPSPGEFERCAECDWLADDVPVLGPAIRRLTEHAPANLICWEHIYLIRKH